MLTDNFILLEQKQALETYTYYILQFYTLTCNLLIFLYICCTATTGNFFNYFFLMTRWIQDVPFLHKT